MSKLLSAEEILTSKDANVRDVDVSTWLGEGAVIRIRSLTAKEAFEFVDMSRGKEDDVGEIVAPVMYKLVLWSCIDGNGNQLFSQDQLEQLKEKSFGLFKAIQKEAMDLNGFGEEEGIANKVDEAKNESSETET